jgi:hypothetical protein
MKVQQLLSNLSVYFDGAEPAGSGPMYGGAEALGKHFAFNEVGPFTGPDGGLFWLAKQGTYGEYRVHQAWGNETELNVVLDITQGARKPSGARSVLSDLWAYLRNDADPSTTPKLEDVGSVVDGTLAIVEVERPFEDIVPVARHMREAVVDHLGNAVLDTTVASSLTVRFSLDVNLWVGHRQVPRKLTIEPRTTARSKANVLFTQSPMPFEKHLAMVRKVVGELPGS